MKPGNSNRIALVALVYVVPVLVFVYAIGRVYKPEVGFTYLIHFGQFFDRRALASVREIPHVVHRGTGYDGQQYAQLAVDPLLRNPEIDRALDNPPYRARRILFSWTAWLFGLGRPSWILQVYALQNVFFWLMLSILLLHWLPPGSVRHYALWVACLFSFPMVFSAQYALLDGPSVLLLAIGVFFVERGLDLRAAIVLGLAGLGRETNLLGALALLRPTANSCWREVAKLCLRLVIVVLPLLLWIDYLRSIYRSLTMSSGGAPAVSRPFVAYLATWMRTIERLEEGWSRGALLDLAGLVSLTVPLLYFLWRRDWRNPWWRMGLVFGLLMVCLGRATWEGRLTGALRVMAPLTIAYNILLASESRWFWPLFALGNLTLFHGIAALRLPYLSRFL